MRGRKATLLIVVLGIAATAAVAQPTVFIVPDVPTDPGVGEFLLPWNVAEQRAGSFSVAPVLQLPGSPHTGAIHKMDMPGHWLFSLDSPNDLAGALTTPAEARDVVRLDGAGSYLLFFCGGAVQDAVPAGVNIDAVYLVGGARTLPSNHPTWFATPEQDQPAPIGRWSASNSTPRRSATGSRSAVT